MADTHTVMPKKLAQALMEAGMQHFDIGGMVNQQRSGVGGLISSVAGSNNDFQAAGVDNVGQIGQLSGQYQDVYGQQQSLANQLLAQTQGGGPGNALVAQQGGNLAAQQAATQAGVRGASANPGLVARNAQVAGQQGQNQVLNAQTAMQLQSQNALAQQQAGMANQSLQGQSIAQGAIAAANNVNAGVAGQNAATNGGIFGGLVGGFGSALGGLFNQGGEVKKMAVGGPVNDNMGITNYSGNGPIALPSTTQAYQPKGDGGGGGGSGLGALALLANGGQVPHMAAGGIAQFGQGGVPLFGGGASQTGNGLGSFLGKGLASLFSPSPTDPNGNNGYNQYAASGLDPAAMSNDASRQAAIQAGGLPPDTGVDQQYGMPNPTQQLPVAGGPGVYAPVVGDPFAGVGPQYQVGQQNPDFQNHAHGGRIGFGQMLAGGSVPGKASVKGDSEKNDTVPTMLSPGEVVLPRSVAQAQDAPAKAAEFMKHLKKKKRGYEGVAEARRGRVS